MKIDKGSILQGEIVDFSHEGNGLVKIDDFVVFLNGGIIGDRVKFKIVRLKKHFANGEILEIIDKSKDRVEVEIEESRGGIPLIELDYDKQLKWKKEKIEQDFYKFEKMNIEVEDIAGMEDPYAYRNHVQIPVRSFNGRTFIGFYQQASRRIVDMDETILLSEEGNLVFKIVKKWILDNNIAAYDERKNKGIIRHIGIRVNRDGQVMLILVTRSNNIPKLDILLEDLKNAPLVSFYQNINRSRSSLVYGRDYKKIAGSDYLLDYIGKKKFKISPKSFFQVNRIQTKILYDKLLDYLQPSKSDRVLDLYCGIGSISIYIANSVGQVCGVEIVDDAIEDARKNTSLNNIENVDFICGKTEEILKDLIDDNYHSNKIILDPPRSGCEEGVIDSIIELNPERIVYVSCNPSTMSRDIGLLVDKGYEVKKVSGVDMFPHTSHVECIALIQKKTI